MGTFNARNTTTTMAVTVNAIMKKSAPAPARTVKRNVTKKTAPAKKPTPAKKPKAVKKTAPVKKSVTVKKTVKKAPAPNKAALSAELAKWYGPNRKLYLPSGLLTTKDIPSYLDGKLAGDYGFDPLGLGADGAISQYRVAEVIHARWAMLAVPGVVIPEALNVAGGDWRETGKVFLDGETGRVGPAVLWLGVAAAAQVVLVGGRNSSALTRPPRRMALSHSRATSAPRTSPSWTRSTRADRWTFTMSRPTRKIWKS